VWKHEEEHTEYVFLGDEERIRVDVRVAFGHVVGSPVSGDLIDDAVHEKAAERALERDDVTDRDVTGDGTREHEVAVVEDRGHAVAEDDVGEAIVGETEETREGYR
jgi:hypothetical protein